MLLRGNETDIRSMLYGRSGMSGKVAVCIASAVSGIAIVLSLVVILNIYNEIASLEDQVFSDMQQFKILSSDSWREMQAIIEQPGGVETDETLTFKTLIGRTKRGANCGCKDNQDRICPAGPAGPKGDPGSDGEDGPPGTNGRDGANGVTLIIENLNPGGCLRCPVGPRGPVGENGSQGPSGPDGKPGRSGKAGKDGKAGKTGPVGDAGEQGNAGTAGRPGVKGKDGRKGVGKPGPKGARGPAGEKGRGGAKGGAGTRGELGPRGPDGRAGKRGPAGKKGPRGERGSKGIPGADAEYCPCPLRNGAPAIEKTSSQDYNKRRRNRRH